MSEGSIWMSSKFTFGVWMGPGSKVSNSLSFCPFEAISVNFTLKDNKLSGALTVKNNQKTVFRTLLRSWFALRKSMKKPVYISKGTKRAVEA